MTTVTEESSTFLAVKPVSANKKPSKIHESRIPFKEKYDLETRTKESAAVKERHPTKIPIVVEISKTEKSLPYTPPKMFLFTKDMIVADVMAVLRQNIRLSKDRALFLFVNGKTLCPLSQLLSVMFQQYHEQDGFLYFEYLGESTFG